jgi:hypothetical protein
VYGGRIIKRRYWFLISLVALLLLAHAGAASSTQAEEPDPPAFVYLTWARDDTAHSINVSWRTMRQGYLGEVRYDTEPRAGDPDLYRYQARGDPSITPVTYRGLRGYVHHVELTGLEPDTIYYFISGHPDYGWSEERAFRTAPDQRTSFRFVEGSDSQARPEDWPKDRDIISRLMAQHNPSFVLFPGDLVEIWNDQKEWDNLLASLSMYWISEEGLTIPIIPAPGNHDVRASGDYDPKKDATNYHEQFNLPGNEQWYALSWGPDLRIFVLDTEATGENSWPQQLAWLESELEASESYLWKIVIFHRDMVSSRGPNPDRIKDLAFLFDKYHVDLVIQGHAQVYERSHPLDWSRAPGEIMPPGKGVIYMVGGAWGGGFYFAVENKWFSAFGPVARYSFQLIDIFENGTLHLKAIGVDGNVFDELVLHKEVSGATGVPVVIPVITVVVIIIVVAIGALYFFKLRKG